MRYKDNLPVQSEVCSTVENVTGARKTATKIFSYVLFKKIFRKYTFPTQYLYWLLPKKLWQKHTSLHCWQFSGSLPPVKAQVAWATNMPTCTLNTFYMPQMSVFLRIQVRASSQTKGPERGWKQRARLGRDAKIGPHTLYGRVRLARFARVRL